MTDLKRIDDCAYKTTMSASIHYLCNKDSEIVESVWQFE